jgi:DNA-binding response OmpR family regulator
LDREGGVKTNPDVRILIVEDDVYFQRILSKRLQAEGYHVTCAADGREGMKLIVTWDPHLVISDWMMPHVDGLELCQSVKTGLKEAAPYFILLTAKGEISDRLLGLDTGADDYLVKPCDQGEIMARVRAGLRTILMARDLQRALSELSIAHAELDATRAEVRRLASGLPLCVTCKKVRTAEGFWRDLHVYLVEHRLSEFAFCTCPECEALPAKRIPDSRAA